MSWRNWRLILYTESPEYENITDRRKTPLEAGVSYPTLLLKVFFTLYTAVAAL